jgi:hypothetical protein
VRRRINLHQLSEKVLIVLHHEFLNDGSEFTSLAKIRKALPSYPVNALRLELEELEQHRDVIQKTEMRTERSSAWAGLSITGVAPPSRYEVEVEAYKLSKQGVGRVERLHDNVFDALSSEIQIGSEIPKESTADKWEPLPIDRESPEVKDVIAASENALKEIEQSNGYADEHSQERNGVVENIKGTLSALKKGMPSRQAIISGLLAPLKFIAEKFSSATMGEAAKIAVAAITKWLFGI